jgi:hypothetical protein
LKTIQTGKIIQTLKGSNYFDEIDYDEAILQAEDDFKVNYFLVMVDMTITSLKSRFEELQSLQSIFEFLMSSVD